MLTGLANRAWWASNAFRSIQFRQALADPARAQSRLLRRYLRDNADTDYGRRHRFADIRSAAEFQSRVPLTTYDGYEPFVARIAAGERSVLTRDPVQRLVPSSGSTQAEKLIPYTRQLQREFNRGIGPWIFDLYRRDPRLMDGRSYWSVSPAVQRPRQTSGEVPIGFDDDSAYLGGWSKRLMNAALAVPSDVNRIAHIDAFRYITLLLLLRAKDLRLISVWHPSFLTLLLESLRRHWSTLLDDVARGSCSAPAMTPDGPWKQLRPDPRRSAELARLDATDFTRIWPHLRLISCWTDAHAAVALRVLRESFPHVRIQGKGLIATEAFVSLPFGGARPLAVRSHFFEFIPADAGDASAAPLLAHALQPGRTYSVVVTTGAGLYRYHLQDRVRVTRLLARTPCLEFVGKEDHVADLFGEKLSEGFVGEVLRQVFERLNRHPAFALLAPDETRYTLFVELLQPGPLPARLNELLDDLLSENPHYRYCRTLNQLAMPAVFRITSGGFDSYVKRQSDRQKLGDIKPSPLSTKTGWAQMFDGTYVEPSGGKPSVARALPAGRA